MFPQMSLFSRHSHWGSPQRAHDNELPPRLTKEVQETLVELSRKELEDWSYRLEAAAYTAEDHKLSELEGTLLDLRDEIVSKLHASLLA